MKAEKDAKTGKWLIQYRYTDWKGERKKSTKRGFETKREAEEWLRNFLVKQQADFNMTFEDFLKIYYEDMESRLRETTMRNKKYMIELKVLPYFGKKKMNEIKASDIRKWQSELMSYRNEKGKPYSQTYLRTLNNQISAIMNFAVRYYDLSSNPCRKAGTMGRNRADEMLFWTRDEFAQFIECVMDKHISYICFSILFWTGMRLGELLALTPEDIDYDNRTIRISKSYQRINGKDVITPPKTERSKRLITIPKTLALDLRDYSSCVYGLEEKDRLFPVTKNYLEREILRGVKLSGVKRIRIHDLRHSHCAMLVEMGFSPLEIRDRLGHETVDTTMNTYAHLYPNKQEKIAQELDVEYRERSE